MIQYEEVNLKLSNAQWNKLRSAFKKHEDVTLKMKRKYLKMIMSLMGCY